MKILHTADLHIGMKFKNYSTFAERLCAARTETLNRLIDTANRAKCDLFVITGDLFDSLYVPKKQIEMVCRVLSRFSGAAVLVLPGNHDCYDGSGRLWKTFEEYASEHTHILHTFQPFLLEELGAAVHGAYCECPHSANNHIGDITPKDGYLNIALGHGSLEGLSPDGEQKYFPMTRRALEESTMDLWLIGHTHVRYPDADHAGGRIFNAGTPEPDGWDCTHGGNAWLIGLSADKQIRARAVRCGSYRFYDRSACVVSEDDMENLLHELREAEGEHKLLRLALSGNCEENVWERREKYFEQIRETACYMEERYDGFHRRIKIDEILREFPEGSFPYRLLSYVAEDEDTLRIAYEMIKEAM